MRMSHFARFAAVLAVGALMMVAAVSAGASTEAGSGPTATASKSCKVGNDRGYGTTYVRYIGAKGVSCARGREIVKGFHKCRKGAKGKCGRVFGYKCSEQRKSGVGSFDSNVSCKKGGKLVKHKYTQFT